MPARPRVLLAEDHEGVARALVAVLEPHCEVLAVVADGRQMIDKAAELNPDISIVDVQMPNVNGLDICRTIRRKNHDAKVILISSMLDDSIVEDALAAGAIDCIHKSRAASQLVDAIIHAWTTGSPPER